MRIKAKFILVSDIRKVNFTNRDGVQKSLVSVSFQIEWLQYREDGKTFNQDLIVESLMEPTQAEGMIVGPITDENIYEMNINFSVNRSKEGRFFNSIRLTRFNLASNE